MSQSTPADAAPPEAVKIGIVSISDRASTGVYEDKGLPALQDWQLENSYQIYPQWRHRYAPGVVRNTERVFGLCVPRPVPVVLSPKEHVSQLWLPWCDAAERCFSPSNAEAILQLPHYLNP